MRRFILITAAALALAGCRSKGVSTVKSSDGTREFKSITIPGVYQEPSAKAEYLADHFWDSFKDTTEAWLCDSVHVGGFKADEIEGQVGVFSTIMGNAGLETARKGMASAFKTFEECEERDTSSNVFERMTDLFAKYFYDPNSPVRNEDIWEPYAALLAKSRYISEGLRLSYDHEASMCRLNQSGTKAADFTVTDLQGKKHTLYGIKGDKTLLFFSNPGCPACREITQQLQDPHIKELISSGKVSVINVYIDEDIEKWKEYAKEYPKEWTSGYDQSYQIRSDVTYNVRAIPSLYLLDKDKRVILKDAPTDKILAAIAAPAE